MAICGNGSLLVELATGRLVRTFPLAADLAMDRVRRMRQRLPGCAFAVEVMDGFGHEIAYVPMHEVPADALVEDALALASRGPTRLLIQHRDLTIIELFERVTAICGTLATAHYSSDSFVEITAPGIDKGSALARLCEDLGIGRNAVVAIGDMPIDLPMLAWAGRGVAVANAHPDVLAAVSETVVSNDEDGVADLLRSLLISQMSGMVAGLQTRARVCGRRSAGHRLLLTEDVRFAMSPLPLRCRGRECAAQFLMVVAAPLGHDPN